MNLSKDPETNWKYILIVAIFACIAIGGITLSVLLYQLQVSRPPVDFLEFIEKEPEEPLEEELISISEQCQSIPRDLWEIAFQDVFSYSGPTWGCEDEEVSIEEFNADCEEEDLDINGVSEYIISWPEICGIPVDMGASQIFPYFLIYQKREGKWDIILESFDVQQYSFSVIGAGGYSDVLTSSTHRDYSRDDISASVTDWITWGWSEEKQKYEIWDERTERYP